MAHTLPHQGQDKMAVILQTKNFQLNFLIKYFILIKISLIYVHKGLIDNKSALAQIMARQQIGHKPLPEPIMS